MVTSEPFRTAMSRISTSGADGAVNAVAPRCLASRRPLKRTLARAGGRTPSHEPTVDYVTGVGPAPVSRAA